jgi:hypothetical protein
MSRISSKKTLSFITFGLSSLALAMTSQMPKAQAITFTGSAATNLNASADFQFNGDNLTVTLTNTSTSAVTNPADLLTGLFFDFNVSKTLNLNNVTLGSGAKVYRNGSLVSQQPTNLKAENFTGGWQYQSGSTVSSSISGFTQGVGTAGFGIFNGNLTGGQGNQQFNYGLLSASSLLTQNANNPVKQSPLIKNSLVFNFTGASGLSESSINKVRFQYGTNLSEPSKTNYYTAPPPPPVKVPEPGMTVTFGFLLLGAGTLLKKNKQYA